MKTFLDYFSLFVADHLLRYFVPKLTQEIKINKTIFLNITFHAALKAMSKKISSYFPCFIYLLEALVFFPPHYCFFDQSPLFQPAVFKDSCIGYPIQEYLHETPRY